MSSANLPDRYKTATAPVLPPLLPPVIPLASRLVSPLAGPLVTPDAKTQVVANVGPAAPLVRQLAARAGPSPLASRVFEMRVLA